jgi:hypothetical protein
MKITEPILTYVEGFENRDDGLMGANDANQSKDALIIILVASISLSMFSS